MKIFNYDLETTGTNPGKNGIHQIAGIIIIDGKEKERFEIKVRPNPKAIIEPEALAVSNVTVEEIMAYQSFEEGYKQLIAILNKYISKYDKKDKFFSLGYNIASFDDNFLRGFFIQNGDNYFGSYFWADVLDVRVLAIRQLMPVRSQMENFKLMTVARQMGIDIEEAKLHDAVYDCDVTWQVFQKLRITKDELHELLPEFQRQEAIDLAFEQICNVIVAEPDSQEALQIAHNVLKKFAKI